MFAVAIVAMVLAGELALFDMSKKLVSDLGDGVDYIPAEALTVWATFQFPILIIACLVYAIVRSHLTKPH
jgi:hypothetical protein